MKINLPLLSAVLATVAPSLAADAPKCPAETPAAAACCAAEESGPSKAVPATALSPRSLYQLDATWTNDAGVPVQLGTLRGRPVVLTMFFASCGYACPVLVNDMQRLRALLAPEVATKAQFVLVSFDTERDTPAALRSFRESSGIDPSWMIVRGDSTAVQELAMLLGVKFKREATGQFSHSNLITILNPEGEITHQRNGLMGDVSEAAKAVVLAVE